jgi:hypothetical protein
MLATGSPPEMAGWNLALRFGLELAALAGFGFAAWKLTSSPLRWIAVIAVPIAAATVWGVFNVLNDPSRSGAAPVEVNGWTRLAIELLILGGGAAAVALAGRRDLGIAFALLIALHYATSWSRLEWLIRQ